MAQRPSAAVRDHFYQDSLCYAAFTTLGSLNLIKRSLHWRAMMKMKAPWDWIGDLKWSAGLFKCRTFPSSQESPQLGRGFRNGEIPPSHRAFHKPASSRSQRPTRQWMAIFAENSQDLCFVAQLTFSDLVGGCILKRPPRSRFLQDFLQATSNERTRSTGREERQRPLVNDCIGRRLLDGRQDREGKAQKRPPA